MNKNDIFVTYGRDPEKMTRQLLDQVDIDQLIGNKNASIGLKPNLVVAKPSSSGATTTPLITETIIRYLQERGYKNLCIIESAWVGDSTKRGFKVCGYDVMSKKYRFPLYDVKDDSYEPHTIDGMKIEMSKRVMGLDFLISLPVLKGHCQTNMTCALKNMKGCISDRSKRYFHSIGLHRPIAALNKIRCADLIIADSLNGDLDFEEGGNPVHTNRMLAARDSVLLDAYGAALMGFELSDVPYIQMAERLGVGCADISKAHVVELEKDTSGASTVSPRRIKNLEGHVCASSACSACYGNLIHALARLEDKGQLSYLREKIYIGQDFKGKEQDGCGIGACCKGFSRHVMGCPPKAIDIVRFLDEELGF